MPMFTNYDKVYKSKIFTFSKDDTQPFDCEIVRGGTGYSIIEELPKEIDEMQPDYSLYTQIDNKTAYGFLTRGCPNKCKWCVVPIKEGNVKIQIIISDSYESYNYTFVKGCLMAKNDCKMREALLEVADDLLNS